MLESDSDEDVIFLLNDEYHNNGVASGDSEEPPRRRMRMDPTTATHTANMTLRSGRSVVTDCSIPLRHLPSPGPVIFEDLSIESNAPPIEIVEGENSSRTSSISWQSGPAGHREADFADFSLGSFPSSTGGFTITSTVSSIESNTIDLELDLPYDQASASGESFESFDIDRLSDVPVNRSPVPSSHESSDPESVIGSANESESDLDVQEISGDHTRRRQRRERQDAQEVAGEAENHYSWERRRLERRNAIVLENSVSQDVFWSAGNQHIVQELPNLPVRTITSFARTTFAVADAMAHKLDAVPDKLDSTACALDSTADKSSEDDDCFTCLICYEPYTNSGDHRLCCLKCGHTYGKICIEKWIKSEARCPQCNAKANRKDVRVLYVKNLKALDTAEKDRILVELGKEQEMKRRLELECTRLRQFANETDMKYKHLTEEHRCLKERVGNVYRDSTVQASPSTTNSFPGNINGGTKPFHLIKSFPFIDGECRVGAYDEWLNMLAVSQTVKSPLYPQGCYGIKRINLLNMKATAITPLHQKEIRDLEFSSSQGDILLSVGLDKKAILTNCSTNVTVQCFTAESPLWSCAWNQLGQYVFYVGTANGQIIAYDVRRPGEVLRTLVMPSDDRTPTARIKFITPSYHNSSFNLSGLLVQKLNSCWFCEIRNEEVKYHQLPVEGSFQSLDFEPKSRHALISTRASMKDKIIPSRHFVCDLTQYHSEVQQANICSSNVVQTYEGNETQLGKLTRASIFSPSKDTVLVAAEVGGKRSSANIWNISTSSPQQVINSSDPILDFVPCRINNDYLLGTISSNNLNIYKQL